MPHDVFISYSTKNTREIRLILDALEQAGLTCWIAPRDVPPGKPWGGVINRAIIDSDVFLILVTEESNSSDQVLKEVGIADHHKKLIVPFFLHDVTLSDDLSYYLTSLHWLVARAQPWEEHVPELVEVVRSRLASKNGEKKPASPVEVSSAQGAAPQPQQAAASSEPPAGATRLREKDGMTEIFIPAGDFLMGSAGDDRNAFADEEPRHPVFLDGYWIDQTPVTNAMFARFLNACGNQKEENISWYYPDGGRILQENNLWNFEPAFEHHPVVSVTWYGANAYAQWVGARLPTEAEWEKAARGTDQRRYPWGNTEPNHGLANYDKKIGTTTPVGRYPAGASPYGVLDLAGNVWQWCADWYSETFYQVSPNKNPLCSTPGENRVSRGGSWYVESWTLRATYRGKFTPRSRYVGKGFRCVR